MLHLVHITSPRATDTPYRVASPYADEKTSIAEHAVAHNNIHDVINVMSIIVDV
jgi:hypothetical protein